MENLHLELWVRRIKGASNNMFSLIISLNALSQRISFKEYVSYLREKVNGMKVCVWVHILKKHAKNFFCYEKEKLYSCCLHRHIQLLFFNSTKLFLRTPLRNGGGYSCYRLGYSYYSGRLPSPVVCGRTLDAVCSPHPIHIFLGS